MSLVMEVVLGICVPLLINCIKLNDPLPFPVASLLGQNYNLSNTLFHYKMFGKLMTISSDSAVLCLWCQLENANLLVF